MITQQSNQEWIKAFEPSEVDDLVHESMDNTESLYFAGMQAIKRAYSLENAIRRVQSDLNGEYCYNSNRKLTKRGLEYWTRNTLLDAELMAIVERNAMERAARIVANETRQSVRL